MQGTKPIIGDREKLLEYLQEGLEKASEVKIIVSFLMESGVMLLLGTFDELVAKGAEVKIITSKYLNLTQPSALYLLKERYGERIKLKFFNDLSKSFHPKTYIIHFPGGSGCVFIGSSNLSRSALTTGVEWNYLFDSSTHGEDFRAFDEAFDEIDRAFSIDVTDDVLREYARNWRRPKVQLFPEDSMVEQKKPEPLPVQREALYELKRTREEGYKKALVIAATGVGKTFLAAFDASNFARVLFVAHREEILKQAEATFRQVMPDKDSTFFNGNSKGKDARMVFAMVQTLGKAEYLNGSYFTPEDFQYIVVDEFHHAAAKSYARVLEYFQPEFLLGLTATPFRMDNREIFSLCENNVAYEVTLKDAINRGWLVPFRYYGVSDIVDYTGIDTYDAEELEGALATDERADMVLRHYLKYRRGKGLGFCATIAHAERMAEYFRKFEIRAVAVHSDEASHCPYLMKREKAVREITKGNVDIIFSVDMFNEGVDIPVVDLVLFLRPTESYTVFLQQLGRGLRRYEGKDYLTVLDFIGNYKNAQLKVNFFAGDMETEAVMNKILYNPKEYENMLPEGCLVDFDFKLIDLFKKLTAANSVEIRLLYNYEDVKRQLGRRPNRYEVWKFGSIDIQAYRTRYGNWLRFLGKVGDLTEEEESWLGTEVEEFFDTVEKTRMEKSYKLPVLLALVDETGMKAEVSMLQIGESFRDFYVDDKVHQKDMREGTHKDWDKWKLEKFVKEARKNPVEFLSKNKFFWFDEERGMFGLKPETVKWFSARFAEHYRDILTWRDKDYFRRRY